jgi:hypothetical protein
MGAKTDEHIIIIDDKKETQGKREFVGRLRCQILRIDPDTRKGDTIIDVRVTEINKNWAER